MSGENGLKQLEYTLFRNICKVISQIAELKFLRGKLLNMFSEAFVQNHRVTILRNINKHYIYTSVCTNIDINGSLTLQ